ncbi:unnamed protein product [Prorocentrum cordatum]|uniref:Rab-GAP TBC domain-containing protein n=1 Tax=Prorocentrum cordatum TaxID=2364126 RepID=A0ABN9SS31_9DINO|nr:unnamed protein product [Polarella glacialis]
MLCFRGIPDGSGLRPQAWKVLLGYLPMARHSEWSAIQGEKRALYASYRSELRAEDEGSKELLQEIQNDVDRTRKDFEFFTRPATRQALQTVLFIYARLNPGVRYVQGMNEVAAVLLYVLSGDAETTGKGRGVLYVVLT